MSEEKNKEHGPPLPPVSEGQELDGVEIISRGEKGDGIARVSGFVIFVPGADAGTKASIRIKKVLKRFAVGELVQAKENAEARAEAQSIQAPVLPEEDDGAVDGELPQ